MAKSIRSKIKRKHRAEFRSTIGDAAYQLNIKKVNENLKKCIERQSMSDEAVEKLQNLFDQDVNEVDDTMEDVEDVAAIDASETMKPVVEVRGENKVTSRLTPSKRSMRRKHKLNSTTMKTEKVATAARKPRYFCQF